MRSLRRLIRAGRMRGDMDLGLEDSRTGSGAKAWAEIDTPGGLLPGRSHQSIYEQSEDPNYRIGTRRVMDDRVFRYAQAASTETLYPTYGVCCDATFVETAVVGTASARGAYTVTCTAQAAVEADEFANGWLLVCSGTFGYWVHYRIRSNTVQATPGGTFVVTLWDPLAAAISASDEVVTLFKNKYKGVRSIRGYFAEYAALPDFMNYVTWVGVAMPRINLGTDYMGFVVSKSYYCWVQTWGPGMGSPVAAYGAEAYEQRLLFYQDGSLRVEDGGVGQLAGYVLPRTYFGAAGHDIPGPTLLVDYRISP